MDDVFIVRTPAQIHASNASMSSTASAPNTGTGTGTHSTRATSPSSSLASLGPPANITASVKGSASPSSISDHAPLPVHQPVGQRDRQDQPHPAIPIPRHPNSIANGVSLLRPVPESALSARVVFGTISGSLTSDGSLPEFGLIGDPDRTQARPSLGIQTLPRQGSDDPVPQMSSMTIAAPSTEGSSHSGTGGSGASPALSATAGPPLSFFPSQPHVQSPHTPHDGWELPPPAPLWAPHSAGHVTPPTYQNGSASWYQPSPSSSTYSTAYYQHPPPRHSQSQSFQPQQWDHGALASHDGYGDYYYYRRDRAPKDRDSGDKRERDIFEVDYTRRPRARERNMSTTSDARSYKDGDAPASRREHDGEHKHTPKSRDGDGYGHAPRGRKNSFARGGGRGGAGSRSQSHPLDSSGPAERGGRGRGRGGYRGQHRDSGWWSRDYHREERERRPPSPEPSSASYWGSSSTSVGMGEGFPLPIPQTLLRGHAGGPIITPTLYFILGQLEFSFSQRNLQKDIFLRQQVGVLLGVLYTRD